jgi:PDZ domain
MSSNGETKIRYLTVDEMLARIDELRARRAANRPLTDAGRDYVAGFELWAAAEAQAAAARIAETGEHRKLGSESVVGDEFVWIGDDLAIRLSPADSTETADALSDAPPAAQVPARQPWRAIPAGMLNRWNPEHYALGTVAVGILALIIGGTALRLVPERQGTPMVASSESYLQAGRLPVDEIQTADATSLLTPAPEAEQRTSTVARRVHPAAVERKIKTALARDGFHDVGVSAGKAGDVYLAANVYNLSEVHSIMRIARHAVGAVRVYFPHPDVRKAQGPAYFGAYAEYAPQVWGAKVSYVTIGSPAFMAGVQPGDVIREFDHHTVADAEELGEAVAAHHPGDRIEIRVWRSGSNMFTIARLRDSSTTQMAMR